MPLPFQALFGATVILFLLLMIQGGLVPANQGLKWGLGPRNEPREASALQGRVARIIANHIESMLMFAPLVFILYAADVSSPLINWGAGLYLIGRTAFAIIYLIGIPVMRSAVWAIGLLGTLMVGFEAMRAVF